MTQYIITMRCVVGKVVTVEAESEAAAETNPWDNVLDETETEMIDWDVKKVEEDK